MKSSFFVPKRRKRYGCEMPALRAISSVERAREAVLGEDLAGRRRGPPRAARRRSSGWSCTGPRDVSYHSLTTACQGLGDTVELGVGEPGVERQRERPLEARVRARGRRPGRGRRSAGAARTCRSGTGSPARGGAAIASSRRSSWITYACQPWRSPVVGHGEPHREVGEPLRVAGGDALAAASSSSSRRTCGMPIAQRMSESR